MPIKGFIPSEYTKLRSWPRMFTLDKRIYLQFGVIFLWQKEEKRGVSNGCSENENSRRNSEIGRCLANRALSFDQRSAQQRLCAMSTSASVSALRLRTGRGNGRAADRCESDPYCSHRSRSRSHSLGSDDGCGSGQAVAG